MIKYLYLLLVLGLSIFILSNLKQLNQLSHSISISIPSPFQKPLPSPTPQTLHLRAVGDIMLGRHVGVQSRRRNDWTWAFQASLPKLPPTDFLLGNLEFPIVKDCPPRSDGMVFCAPLESIEGLTFAGFDLVSLANNHSGNYGASGLKNTIDVLGQNNIASLVEYQTTIIHIQDVPIGFLALHDLYTPIDITKTTALIQTLTPKTAAVIVLVHWGNEYETFASERQKKLAQAMIDAGANLILGSHPHVLQPIEVSSTTLVAYSLGNFVFDQMFSEPTRKGAILDLDLTFTDASLSGIKYSTHPTTIFDYGQPRLDNEIDR